MSKEALAKVVQQAISDGGFRRRLASDPAGALSGFDLTADEATAIRSGDAGRLSALGVDQRMSKAFTLGGGGDTATKLGGTDISGSFGDAVTSGSGATGGSGDVLQSALVSGGTNDSDALVGGGSQLGSAFTSGDDAAGAMIPTDPTLGGDMLASDPAHAFAANVGTSDELGNTLTSGDENATSAFTTDGGAGAEGGIGTNAGEGPDIAQ